MKRSNNISEEDVLGLVDAYEKVSQNGLSKKFSEHEYIKLSSYYSDNGEYPMALEVLEDALVYYPFSITFMICKSQIFVEQGKLEEAFSILAKAEIYSPYDYNLLLLKADVLNQMGRNELALSVLEKAPVDTKENLSELYLFKAIIHEQLDNLDEMLKAIKMSIEIDHTNTEALEQLWWSFELTGKYKESINFHKEIIAKDPYSYLAWYNLGYAFFNLGNYEKAANAMEYSYLISPDFLEAYKMAAESYIHLKEIDKAMDCYSNLLGMSNPDSEIYTKIGYCFEEQGNDDDAKRHYLLAVRMNANDHLALFHLAEFYKKNNDYKNSISSYLKAIKLDDRNELYFYSLADTYAIFGEHELAILNFRRAIDLAVDVSDYWIDFAGFYIDKEEYQMALNLMEEATDFINGPELLLCKAACLYYLEDYNTAEYALRDALSQNPTDTSILFDLAPFLKENISVQLIISYFQTN